MRGALIVTATALLGCDVDHAITVRVRDPRAVALEVDTPSGRRLLLPPGAERMEVPLPPDAPVNTPSVAEGRSAARLDAGAIEVRCPHCNEYPEMLAVDVDGTILMKHAAGDAITWGPEGLRLRFVHFRIGRGGRRGGRMRREAFDVALVTPTANVVEITDYRTAPRTGARPRIFIGFLDLALGIALTGVGLGVRGLPVGARAGFVGAGGAWATLGGFAMGTALYELEVADTTVRLYPR
jgi:hypothetical protein